MAYGPICSLIGQAATYVDRILKGAKTADFGQQSDKIELVTPQDGECAWPHGPAHALARADR